MAAVLIGLTLSGVAAAAVYFALGEYLERQGVDELAISARRVIALTESRLDQVTEALEELARRQVRSCADADRDAMNEVSFRVVPVKEVAIVGPDGRTRCTNLAIPFGHRQVLAAPISNARRDLIIEVMHLGEHSENAIRVRRATADGLWLAAAIPSDLLLPRISRTGGPVVINASLASNDGIVIGARAAADPANTDPEDSLVVRSQSDRFGFAVTTSISRGAVRAAHRSMVAAATIGTAGTTVLMLALAAYGPLRARKDPAAELRRAIRNGELVPYYQPIIDLNSARVVSAEVLVRWRKGDGSLVPPAQFIPLAEQSGLIVELTRALMRRVCVEAGDTIGARPQFRIGFNLSAQHFLDESVVEDVRAIFGASPIGFDQVLLEVTERQALDNLTVARRVIAALQGLGVHVGIDDLGTGHSGLSYMLKLGVDFIKIDKMFVDAIDTERYSGTIIETLVILAHDMQMEIIAEGVETFEQVQLLRERGIRKAQGYVFAPPLPGSSFLRLLAASEAAAVASQPEVAPVPKTGPADKAGALEEVAQVA
jgi:sensor c-di-GMP phosphodiesterase-like protein